MPTTALNALGVNFSVRGHEVAGGVIDQRVDFADFGFGGSGGGFYGGVVTDVAGREGCGATCFFDFFADGFEGFGAAADDEYARAEGGEMQGHGATEAGAAARQENDFDLSVSG